MRCLVTGGAGFIGSRLCEALVKQGNYVTCIDNLSTGMRSNISHLEERNNFVFHEIDLLFKCFDFEKYDVIFHLAAKADIVPSIASPEIYHNTNVGITFQLLELARKMGAKFIYAASSSCYGIPEEFPTSEQAECNPQYPYALTKYIGEQYVLHWAKVYGVSALSLRLFNVYGPRHRTTGAYGAVFGTFLSQLANSKPITIVGDGTQTRDFTWVGDVVDAFIRAAGSDRSGEVYNVGSDQTYSVNYLADLLGAKDRVYIPKRPGEPDCTYADVKKIKAHLKWEPKISFEEGVGEMKDLISHYKTAPLWTPETIAEETKDWFKYLDKDRCITP